MRLPGVSADSFGSSAFRNVGELGQEIQRAGDRIQKNEDDLNIIKLSGEYDAQLDQAKTEILNNPAIHQHADMLSVKSAEIHDALVDNNSHVSPAVQQTLAKHVASRQAPATIELLHAGQVKRVQQVRASYDELADQKMQQAAMDPRKTKENMMLIDDVRSRHVETGVLSAEEAQKKKESEMNRYWSTFAQTRPQELLDTIKVEELTGSVPQGMDAQHKSSYINTAVNTIHTQQQGQLDAEKAQAKAQKEMQEQNASSLAADVLEGKPIQDRLAAMVRTRMVDDGKVSSLIELQSKMTQVPDMKLYQRGTATKIESSLRKIKYEPGDVPHGLEDDLYNEFMQGHILKDEYIHLSSVLDGVKAHKMDEAKTPKNSAVSRAAANLEQVLESANKLTGFSAVGNQATANAKEYFYQRVEQEPNANPWDIMHDAETRFKPIVEKQQGISETDQMLLSDAKREAGVRLGTISKAASKAIASKEQGDRAHKIVSDTLKALPPPPPPGILERLGDFFSKKEKQPGLVPRREPGVMGE